MQQHLIEQTHPSNAPAPGGPEIQTTTNSQALPDRLNSTNTWLSCWLTAVIAVAPMGTFLSYILREAEDVQEDEPVVGEESEMEEHSVAPRKRGKIPGVSRDSE
ncbi:hypothetical protein ABBQ38_006315 [Trebouxia sp. C0009 RCD-2024]